MRYLSSRTLSSYLGMGVVVVLFFAIIWASGIASSLTGSSFSKPIGAPIEVPDIEGPIVGNKVTLEEARLLLPWSVPLPQLTVDNAQLSEVWISPVEEVAYDRRQLAIVYDDGMQIIITPQKKRADAWFNQVDGPFVRTTVNGLEAKGKDPGVQELEDHATRRYPASLTWWEEGLTVDIFSDDRLLEDLVEIAESMPSLVWD